MGPALSGRVAANPAGFGPWGFESPSRHWAFSDFPGRLSTNVSALARWRPSSPSCAPDPIRRPPRYAPSSRSTTVSFWCISDPVQRRRVNDARIHGSPSSTDARERQMRIDLLDRQTGSSGPVPPPHPYGPLSGGRLGLDHKRLFLQPPMASHPRARASIEARARSRPRPPEASIARISDVEWSFLTQYTTTS